MRVSVPCMFDRIRASLAPSFRLANSLFSRSIAFSLLRTVCAAPLVSFMRPSSRSVHSRCCSDEIAVRHSPWFCSISRMLYLIVCIDFFTVFTSSKKAVMAGD